MVTEDKLAFNAVEPFILIVVQVSCRTTFLVKRVLQDQEIAAVLSCHFESNDTDTKTTLFAIPIFTGSDEKDGWNTCLSLH